MELATIVDRLDEELRTDAYADLDASANGLQVGSDSRSKSVDHVAFAVDAALETIQAAGEAGADLLVTHHGLSWGGIERVTGRTYDRLEALLEHDMALYVSHLPLDGHQELGNAAGVADVLGLEEREPFGEYGPEYIGQRGKVPKPYSPTELQATLEAELATGGQPIQVLEFGPEAVETVAIVTGSGVDWLDEALGVGADALVTGEGKQQVYHDAKEAGVHVVLAGHYATETFGVEALEGLAREWGLETTLLEAPTGL
ncbi:Nif3-like dinuclear metal center hexameric protein [Natrialbaceae archaeon A-CW1-1]